MICNASLYVVVNDSGFFLVYDCGFVKTVKRTVETPCADRWLSRDRMRTYFVYVYMHTAFYGDTT